MWISQPDQGLHLAISQQQPIPNASVDPTIKNYHWLDLVMGQFEAYNQGAQTAAVVDDKGNIKEGLRFNIFIIKDRQLRTTTKGVLEGITRKTAIQLAHQLDLQVELGEISAQDLRKADEAFATSTAGGIMAITQADHQVLGRGQIGPLTKQL